MRLGLACAAFVFLVAGAAGQAANAPLPVRVDQRACGDACPGDRSPLWSPDGKRIAFIRYVKDSHGIHQAIYTIAPHGSGARLVYSWPAGLSGAYPPYRALAWSPDSTRLGFATDNGAVWTVGLDRSPPRMVAPPRNVLVGYLTTTIRWSADGRRLVFDRWERQVRENSICCEIWVAETDGSRAVRVAGGHDALQPWASQPVWSTDGRIAYVSGPRDPSLCAIPTCGGERYDLGEIHLMNADGTGDRVLRPASTTGTPVILGWPAGGDRLLVSLQNDKRESVGIVAVFADGGGVGLSSGTPLSCCWLAPAGSVGIALKHTPAGTELRTLALGLGTGGEGAFLADGVGPQANVATTGSWSPDGRSVAFLADGECATLIAVYVAEDGRARRQTNPCRRVGTPRDDRLTAKTSPKALYGRGGRDELRGAGGPDYLDGGDGADTLHGDDGDDRLVGGRGSDRLTGGEGWDRIYARDGTRDTITCGAGSDGVVADRLDSVARDCEVVQRP